MKAASNVIAILAWGSFLAAIMWPLVVGRMPALGPWVLAIAMTFVVGVIVPSFLLGVEARAAAGADRKTPATGARKQQ